MINLDTGRSSNNHAQTHKTCKPIGSVCISNGSKYISEKFYFARCHNAISIMIYSHNIFKLKNGLT